METLEKLLLSLGVLLLSGVATTAAWSEHGRRTGLAEVEGLEAPSSSPALPQADMRPAQATKPRRASALQGDPGTRATTDRAVAALRIPRLGLEVPVRNGTSRGALGRGAGLIEGSAAPGSDGNVALAGHRDSFFRGLRDVAVGDLLELQAIGGVRRYHVTHVFIVGPAEVGVLDPLDSPAITLVTCFPFDYLGPAPQRFIVRGAADSATN